LILCKSCGFDFYFFSTFQMNYKSFHFF
jgi:hypothetical protein